MHLENLGLVVGTRASENGTQNWSRHMMGRSVLRYQQEMTTALYLGVVAIPVRLVHTTRI